MDYTTKNEIEDDLIDEAILVAVTEAIKMFQPPVPERIMTGQPGHIFLQELLKSKSQERIRRALRMNISTFYALRDWLLKHTLLENRRTVTAEEKLAIFIHIVSRPASNRDTAERFSHSGDTISK